MSPGNSLCRQRVERPPRKMLLPFSRIWSKIHGSRRRTAFQTHGVAAACVNVHIAKRSVVVTELSSRRASGKDGHVGDDCERVDARVITHEVS